MKIIFTDKDIEEILLSQVQSMRRDGDVLNVGPRKLWKVEKVDGGFMAVELEYEDSMVEAQRRILADQTRIVINPPQATGAGQIWTTGGDGSHSVPRWTMVSEHPAETSAHATYSGTSSSA